MEAKLTVLKQETVFASLEDGSVGQVVRVTFRTPLGVIGTVEVPARNYSADVAKAAIQAKAAELDEVQSL